MDELDFDSPRAEQPKKINIALWPHQKAIMHVANRMENGEIFEISPTMRIRPNIGYINDPIGAGKTLTVLGIVAQKKAKDIYKSTEKIIDNHYYTKWNIIPKCSLETTLIVVNNHIVFQQWIDTIQNHTSLKMFSIDRKKDYDFIHSNQIIEHLNKFHIVITKKTLLRNFIRYFDTNELCVWKRIIYDEAHETFAPNSFIRGDFTWLITGSYLNIEDINYFRLKSKQEFCNSAINLPQIIMKEYICMRDNIQISVVKQFLTPEIMSHINAGDYNGALKILNGNNDAEFHETDIITALTKNLERELKDTILTIDYTKHKMMQEYARKEALEKLDAQKNELEIKIKTIRERIESLRDEKCSICLEDEPKNKIIIQPCLHVACGECMFQYINFRLNKNESIICQMCRTNIDMRNMRIVDPNAPSTSASASAIKPIKQKKPLLKLDQALKIIKRNPNGRFLIFAQFDVNFKELIKHVKHSEILSGDSVTIRKIVANFKDGIIKSLIINSRNYAAGMNFEEATDIILMQDLGVNEAQCIGRAQRPGRTQPLRVHKLIYEDE